MSVKLVLVRGLPGAGKSTLAEKINSELWKVESPVDFCDRCETDNYWYRPDGVYDFNQRLLGEAHEWNRCQVEEIIDAVRSHTDCLDVIIVSNTFTTLKEMQPYLNMVDAENVVVVHCTNNYGSIHDVPSHTINKMEQRWQDTPSHLREIKYDGENFDEVLDFVLA